ncbi:hypothetical protein BST36_17370 [Mycolicibacterium moriokaense]|uniref:Helix-turn-helix domain-containing protein n=1 Tax=Mycolicibacterium moriokaense TaxID=39691 RepID=A0AAD1HF75_9MYCO|nr:hypothetical protein [Mycolicibacterium moriokaense]MCV7037359.1 hypothetical protein [Mycolicibacterium moriokaense]ORB21258.1 hypothetical protein BST36_17370 [Mycolicibacterium moriokaense]BBX04318.1 hypothetical protein MMOR_52540 [Mycolicibacterium moriokaense]
MSTPPILQWDKAYNRNGDPKLPRTVVNVIRTYMDNHTLTGFVKQETLAEATGLTVRGVRKQIAANVAAGWLEIVSVGNSSGKATDYRLTIPKEEPQFRLPSSKAEPQFPLEDGEGGTTVPVKEEPQFLPTSPSTSPKRSTSPTEGEPQFPLPGTGLMRPGQGIDLPPDATGQSKAEPQFLLSDEDQEALAEERLLAVLADGPIPAKAGQSVTQVPQQITNTVIKRLIRSGVIVHDKETPVPELRLSA